MPFNLLDILFFLVVLGIAVTVHEWGHFIIARRMGVRVLRFSIGFGPPLYKIQRGETEYCIAPIPLGGYVKMAGESYEEELEGQPWEFLSASPWRRIAIVFAGPAMNLILAAVIFFLIFFFIGMEFTATRSIGEVIPGSLGAAAGLEAGDILLEVNGEEVSRWEDFEREASRSVQDIKPIRLRYQRGNQVGEAVLPVEIVTLEEGVEILKTPPVLDIIDPVGPAWTLGLQRGDEVLSVGGVEVQYWHEVYDLISRMIERDETGTPKPKTFEIRWRTMQGEEKSGEVTPLLIKQGREVLPKIGIGAATFGILPAEEPIVGKVKRDSPARAAGIRKNDRIVMIDGVPIRTSRDMHEIILRAYEWNQSGEPIGKPLEVTWLTANNENRSAVIQPTVTQTQVPTTLGLSSGRKSAIAEIGVQIKRDREKFGLLGSLGKGIEETADWCVRFFDLFRRLITGEVSVRLVGGPIAIAQGSAHQARWGAEDFFRWIAILSANLAVINLFPIPILDGGHIVFCLIEVVRKKRMSPRVLEWSYRLAFFLFLLPLIVLIFYVDIDRLGWFDSIRRLFGR